MVRPERLSIFVSNRVENVERFERLFQRDDLVAHVAGNAEQISRLQRLLLAADGKNGSAFQDDAHLLMGVGMLVDDGVRLQGRHRKHHLLGRAGRYLNSGENRVTGAFVGGGEIKAHASQFT